MEDKDVMSEAPTSDQNKLYYNCSECQSTIDIIKLDEEIIEFKCTNKHHKEMKIKDYLNIMRKYNSITINNHICDKHNKEYFSYCFECNIHLCLDCLKLCEHTKHYKCNLIELNINNEILKEIKNKIENNNTKLQDLIEEKKINEKALNDLMSKNSKKIENIRDKNLEENKKAKQEKIKQINNKYMEQMKKIKIEYENKIKLLKLNHINEINNIKNTYNIINYHNNSIYNEQIN